VVAHYDGALIRSQYDALSSTLLNSDIEKVLLNLLTVVEKVNFLCQHTEADDYVLIVFANNTNKADQ